MLQHERPSTVLRFNIILILISLPHLTPQPPYPLSVSATTTTFGMELAAHSAHMEGMLATQSPTLVVSVIVFLLTIGMLRRRPVGQTVAFCPVRPRQYFHVTARSVRNLMVLR
jgi:hypothetical protein